MLINKDNGIEYVFRGMSVKKLAAMILLTVLIVGFYSCIGYGFAVGKFDGKFDGASFPELAPLFSIALMFVGMSFLFFYYFWGLIKYREQLTINGSGITSHERKLSFFKGFYMTTNFYSWNDISKVYMEQQNAGRGGSYSVLCLIDRNEQKIEISLACIRVSEDELFDAVRDCCPARDIIGLPPEPEAEDIFKSVLIIAIFILLVLLLKLL